MAYERMCIFDGTITGKAGNRSVNFKYCISPTGKERPPYTHNSPRLSFVFPFLDFNFGFRCRRAGGTIRAADVVEGTLQLGGGAHLHPPELRGPWHEVRYLQYGVLMHFVCVGVRFLVSHIGGDDAVNCCFCQSGLTVCMNRLT